MEHDAYYFFGWSVGIAAEEAIRKALNKVGYPISGEDIYNVLCTDFIDVDMRGLYPNVTFGPEDRIGASEGFWLEVRSGKMVKIGSLELPHLGPVD